MPSYTRPKEGSTTASVWDACDAFTLKNKGQLPTAADIRAMLPEVNKATVQTQCFKWRSTNHPDSKAKAAEA